MKYFKEYLFKTAANVRYYISFISILLINVMQVKGQTINNGELSIREGTTLSCVNDFDNTLMGDLVNDGTLLLYGNYNNEGLVSFTPGSVSGLAFFRGISGAQTISGSVVSQFNNTRFDNDTARPAFFLKGDISIAGNTDFVNGIIENSGDAGSIIFEKNAGHRYAGNESYVSGFVERSENSFEFPIGDNGFFRSCAIGVTDTENHIFRSRYQLKNSNILYPHNRKMPEIQIIDDAEYWQLEGAGKNVETALTLSWDKSTTPLPVIEGKPGSTIAIVRWNDVAGQWQFYPTAVDFERKIAMAGIKEDGVFTLARVSSSVSEDLVVFNALSPNEDGLNDFLRIDGLENFPDNHLQIYNRWGVKVYETSGYGLNNNFFKGYSQGRATFNKGEKLPSGTYFYLLVYSNATVAKKKAGYLYIN